MDEGRQAAGYEPLGLPNMDVPLIPMGLQRIDEIGIVPDMAATENALKYFKDYRIKVN